MARTKAEPMTPERLTELMKTMKPNDFVDIPADQMTAGIKARLVGSGCSSKTLHQPAGAIVRVRREP